MRGHNVCLYAESTKSIPNYHQILPLIYSSDQSYIIIHVINFKEASGIFFFHFLEIYRIYTNILHSFPGGFKILVKSDIF